MGRFRIGFKTATALVAAATFGALFAPASTANAYPVINGWNTVSTWKYRCHPGGFNGGSGGVSHDFCLYYSPGAWGAFWGKTSSALNDVNLSDNSFWNDGLPANYNGATGNGGSVGAGQTVNDNSASVENGWADVELWTFTNASASGDYSCVQPGRGGNFTSDQRNRTSSLYITYLAC